MAEKVTFLKLSSILDEMSSSKKGDKSKLLKSFIENFQSEAIQTGKPFCEVGSWQSNLSMYIRITRKGM